MGNGGFVISHWHALVDDFDSSSLDFYASVEEAVRTREVPDAEFSRVEFKEGGVASAKREYLRVERGRVAFDVCAAPFGKGFFFSWWLVRPGPAHPWLWFLALFGVVGIWLLMLANVASQMAQQSVFGGDGGAGCSFLFLFLGLPVGLALLGWGVREGHIGDEEVVMDMPIIGWLYERLFNPQTYYRHDTALMFQESISRAVNQEIDSLLSSQGLRALTEDQKKPTMRDLAR